MLILYMINLLPYKEKKLVERVRFIRLIKTVCVGFIALLLVVVVLLVPTFLTIDHRYKLASDQVTMLVKNEKMVSDVDVAVFQKDVERVEQKLSQRAAVNPLDFIATVRALVPKGVEIERLSATGGMILEVYGVASSRETLQAFIDTLQTSPTVAMVDNPLSNLLKTKEGDFKVTITFKQ